MSPSAADSKSPADSTSSATTASPPGGDSPHLHEREGRRFALGAIFEADFGQTTPARALERRLEEDSASPQTAEHARRIVDAVARNRDTIDAQIGVLAPAYPVVQLARMDRALLRSGMGELLHCPTTPARVAISEWVELARTYSGDPARRLMNGVLGRVAREANATTPARRQRVARTPTTRTTIDPKTESNDSGGSTE